MDLEKTFKEGLEPLKSFPEKVINSTTDLRNEDLECNDILKGISAHVVAYAKVMKKATPDQKKHFIDKLNKMYDEVKVKNQKKVQIAGQLYDSIDNDIKVMDKTTKNFDIGSKRGGSSDDEPEVAEGGRRKKKKKKTGSNSVQVEMPVDPYEPIYCICHSVASGEMVCCDNDSCKLEWFHFDCMGIKKDTMGKAKWYCEECRPHFKDVANQWNYETNEPPSKKKKTKK